MCGPTESAPASRSRAVTAESGGGCSHLRGHVLPAGDVRDVYVVDGRTTFERVPDADTIVDGGWLVPGLVDSHAHLALASPAGRDATPEQRVEASARAQLAAGVLLVREPGAPNHASGRLGPHLGLPRTVTAGRFLAPPGRYFPGLAREVPPDRLAAAVVEEAAAGSGWVKIIGDYPDSGGRLAPNWEQAALDAAVGAAHAMGVRITMHAVMPETIDVALATGFDAIEHGTGMPRDLVPELAARGIAWVPTLLISEGVRRWARHAMAPAEWPIVEGWLDALPGTVAAAARAGVRLLAGTDAGMVPHGMIAAEVGLLVQAGVPASIAVGAASWAARDYLGLPGIEEGAPADLVAFPSDPRQDPGTLTRQALTILDGRRVVPAPEPRGSSDGADPARRPRRERADLLTKAASSTEGAW